MSTISKFTLKAYEEMILKKSEFVIDSKILQPTEDSEVVDIILSYCIDGFYFPYHFEVKELKKLDTDAFNKHIELPIYLFDKMFVNVDIYARTQSFFRKVYIARYLLDNIEDRKYNTLGVESRLSIASHLVKPEQDFAIEKLTAVLELSTHKFTSEELNLSWRNFDDPEFNPSLRLINELNNV